MRKITLLFSAMVFGLSLSSCSDDDASFSESKLIGAWAFNKVSYTYQGVTIPETDYDDNEAGCSKDYIEFQENGVANEVDYYNASCEFEVSPGTWAKSGNNIVLSEDSDDDMPQTFTVVSLTDTALKVKYTYTDEDDSDEIQGPVTVFVSFTKQ